MGIKTNITLAAGIAGTLYFGYRNLQNLKFIEKLEGRVKELKVTPTRLATRPEKTTEPVPIPIAEARTAAVNPSLEQDALSWRAYQQQLGRDQKKREEEDAKEASERRRIKQILGEPYERLRRLVNQRKVHLGYIDDPDQFEELAAEIIPNSEEPYLIDGRKSKLLEGSFHGKALIEKNYMTLVFRQSPTKNSNLETKTYASLFYEGDMDGTVKINSYTSIIVDGAMYGTIDVNSYADILLNGPFYGEILNIGYHAVHLSQNTLGTLKGKIRCKDQCAIFVHGYLSTRNILDILEVTTGTVTVYFKESDLALGKHQIAEHVVAIVGPRPEFDR